MENGDTPTTVVVELQPREEVKEDLAETQGTAVETDLAETQETAVGEEIDSSASESSEGRKRAQAEPLSRFEAVDGHQARDTTGMECKGPLLCCGLVTGSIVALLIVILVPLSFSDLEYYEMGFVKRKSTGTVDRSKVYMGGRHLIGVDATFKAFKADAHIEYFQKMEFFNKDKLQVTMSFSIQYFLMPEELKSLHDAYDLSYRPVLRNTARSAIKDAATKFTVDEYRKERPKVAAGLFRAAKIALGGTCCYSSCKKYTCLPGCTNSNCTKGLFAYVKYFQLEEVDITDDQEKKFLQTVIEREKRDTENFKQDEKIKRKETEQQKKKIENDAAEVTQNAAAKSAFINAQAEASAKATVENARNSGLQQIFTAVNITSESHKKSLDYIRTLLNHKTTNMYVGFTTMIAKEGA